MDPIYITQSETNTMKISTRIQKGMESVLKAWLTLVCALVGSRVDADKADTAANIRFFRRRFGFPPGRAYTGIVCLADELGADVWYQLVCTCDGAAMRRLVRALGLQSAPAEALLAKPREMPPGWPAGVTKDLPAWSRQEFRRYRTLWFSEQQGRLYYLEYTV